MDILDELNINNLRDISTHEIKSKIRRPFKIFWRDTINKDSKLRTYQKIKDHFRYEDYLGQLKFCERRLITKLRISANNLRIEAGDIRVRLRPLKTGNAWNADLAK